MTFFLITKTTTGLDGNSRNIQRFKTVASACKAGVSEIKNTILDGDAMEQDFLDDGGDIKEAVAEFKSDHRFSVEFNDNEFEIKIVEISDAEADAFERGFNS